MHNTKKTDLPAELSVLLTEAEAGSADSFCLALDWLEDHDFDRLTQALRHQFSRLGNPRYFAHFCADLAGRVREHFKALALHEALRQVDLDAVPVSSGDRRIPRKQQAKMARALFSRLKLKGISITAPSYSMASSVHVNLPQRFDAIDLQGTDVCRVANREALRKVEEILSRAFPNHDDRSDTQTDYFDFCWSIS